MKYINFVLLISFLSVSCSKKEKLETKIIDPLAQYRDTLIGKFDGINVDTLIAEPIGAKTDAWDPDNFDSGWYYNWRIFSKKGTVKDLVLENKTIGIKFVKEGDVDGDGKEEWGFLTEWPTSAWMVYRLYHNENGNWELLIEPTSIWLDHLEENDTFGYTTIQDVIQKSEKPGYLKIKFSEVRNEGEDFLLIDTLIQIPATSNQ